jgi:hypothetical protein
MARPQKVQFDPERSANPGVEPTIVHNPVTAGSDYPAVTADTAVSEKVAAGVLGLSAKTLSDWRWRQIGPPYLKYSGRHGSVRYLLSDLLTWQQAHRRSGA